MASGVFTNAMQMIAESSGAGSINLQTDTIKIMLLDQTPYAYDPDDEFIEEGVADFNETELLATTGYAGTFGGAGRHTLTAKVFNEDDANNKAIFDSTANETWTALGPAGDNLGSSGLVKEITTDLDSFLICHIELPDTTLTGADFTIVWNSGGIIEWTQI